ncbi:MAG: hypothetical protein DLM59_17790 [Pseudonocardiales bacterium]|nr:MAG: hypothetical protein DLM59_17790 [Pseudonocardiales bacterium]
MAAADTIHPGRKWTDWEARLRNAPASAPALFSGSDLDGLPEPVRRYLTRAIAPDTRLTRCVHLRMRGSIKLRRWLPFRARQILSPHDGFIWAARVAGVIAGSDRYLDGDGGMDWKLAGLVTLVHQDGPDVSRSAAGRGGAEAVWLPTTLLPRFGVRWSAQDDTHITASYQLGDTPIVICYTLDPDGYITSFVFDRWGDPDSTGLWAWHPFGGEITAQRTFGGLTIPGSGRLGWHFGTDRWPSGEFFRYQVTQLQPTPDR